MDRSFAKLAATWVALIIMAIAGVCVAAPVDRAYPEGLHLWPYLQRLTTNSVTVMWETVDSVQATVKYGAKPNRLKSKVADAGPVQVHEITLTGLKPGTTYYYECNWKKGNIPSAQFTTVYTSKVRPFRFVAYGDNRSDPKMHSTLVSLIAAQGPEFVLNSGDLVGDGRDLLQWKPQFFDPLAPLADHIPVYTILGNHERNSEWYYQYFSLPNNEAWWSMDYGSMHLIALDSNQPGAPGTEQYEWLETDLKANRNAQWVVVFYHHPPFSGHPTRGINRNRWDWHPLFEKYGVDLVVNGHDHHYHRTYEIGSMTGEPHRGVRYLTTGGGGAGLYPSKDYTYTAVRYSTHHIVVFDVSPERILGRAVDHEGRVFDEFVIGHTALPSPAEFVSWEALRMEEAMRQQLQKTSGWAGAGGQAVFVDTLRIPNTFSQSAQVNLTWTGGGEWKVEPASSNSRIEAGDTAVVAVSLMRAMGSSANPPEVMLRVQPDLPERSQTEFPIGFRNRQMILPMLDSAFGDAIHRVRREDDSAPILEFLDRFPEYPDAGDAYFRLARFFSGKKDSANTIKYAEAMVQHDAGMLKEKYGRLRLAQIYLEAGLMDRSKQHLEAALALAPGDASFLAYLGGLLIRNDMEVGLGVDLCVRANRLEPDDHRVWGILALGYAKLQQHERSEEWLQKTRDALGAESRDVRHLEKQIASVRE